MTAATTEPMFILNASKRAVKLVNGAWVNEDKDFLRRWPDNRRPDIGIRRSNSADKLAEEATRLNDAQIRSGFLDWLYSVDLDAPVHPECTALCPTHPDYVKGDGE